MNLNLNTLKPLFVIIGISLSINTYANSVVNIVVNDNYADVRDNLVDAIEQKSIKISKIFHASDMLDRTKGDVFNMSNMYSKLQGNIDKVFNMSNYDADNKNLVPKKVYKKAEIIEFCSADISHELVLANPLNIAVCPFKIAIFSLRDSPQQTHIIYNKLTAFDNNSKAAIAKANNLIKSLAESASW